MKESGCMLISYGVESFSDRMLKLMGKGYDATRAVEVLHLTKNTGIKAVVQVLLGYPGEDEYSLRETFSCLKLLRKIICNKVINIYELHPGSIVYEQLKKSRVIDDSIWHHGFRVGDFIKKFYPPRMLRKIYETKYKIEKM